MRGNRNRIARTLFVTAAALVAVWTSGPVEPQTEQVVEVVIKNFTYVTNQKPLRLGVPTMIKIVNEDSERHDFELPILGTVLALLCCRDQR